MCATNFNDSDLVVVPMISLNPKKAKKKMKKAARAEDTTCVDSRLPVDKLDVASDSIEVMPPIALNSGKVKKSPVKSAVSKVEKSFASPAPQADCTPTFQIEGAKKSWYDITMDDDDDFCGALSN